MAEKTQEIRLQQGKTQPLVLRIETDEIAYKAITAITQTAPVGITAAGHGLVQGWRSAVTNVKGMTEINAVANEVKDRDYHPATVVDPNTVQFNDVNAAGFKSYVSGGYLQYNVPMDLAGYSARMDIRDKKNGSTILDSFTTANGLIEIDNALKTVTIYFDAIDFTALTWKKGYYELELFKDITRGGNTIEYVYSPIEGPIFLDAETTK